jgi:threonine dehydratase
VTAELTQLLHDVLKSRVYDVARETALDVAPRLSERLGNEVLFKREDLQPIFSFKIRGAYKSRPVPATTPRASHIRLDS